MRKVVFKGNTLEAPDDARHRAGYEIDGVQRDKEPQNEMDRLVLNMDFNSCGLSKTATVPWF